RDEAAAGRFAADPATTERVGGRAPTAAAIAIAGSRFDAAADGADGARRATHVVLARDDDFADSLAGTALTADGPLLLTATGALTPATGGEIGRVLPVGGRVYLLGGSAAVGTAVEDGLRADGYEVRRLAGTARVETALAVADEVRSRSGRDEVLLARAYGFETEPTSAWADSVTAGGLAAAAGIPVLLTPSAGLHPGVATWLQRDAPALTVLLGGTVALSEAVAAAVPNPVRVSGPERTATAAAVASVLWGAAAEGPRSFVVVPGERRDGWAFGLPAAGLSADSRAPILLVGAAVSDATAELVGACGAPQVGLTVVGDATVVSGTVRERLDALDGRACGPDGALVYSSALQPADSCADLLDYFREAALERVGPYGLGEFVAVAGAGGEAEIEAEGGFAPAAPAGAVSGTNVQEAGVDEPDLVKTDGRLALVAAQGGLQVVDLTGGAPALAASLALPDGWDHELLVETDTALVLSRGYRDVAADAPSGQDTTAASPVVGVAPQTTLTLVDLSDPSQPRAQASLQLDGDYVSARMTGGVARVVVHSYPHDLAFTSPTEHTPEAVAAATEHNRRVVESSTLGSWLPSYTVEDPAAGSAVDAPLLDCAQVSRPPRFSGLGTLSVLTFDLGGTLAPTSAAAVVANGETVYASPRRLYVATTRWGLWEPSAAGEPVTSEIHGFDIADPAATRYTGSGSVSGYLLNQFALSEHDGYLRVASTQEPPWDGDPEALSESAVTVLAERDGALVQVGRLGGLGLDERIFAVRFLGDVAAVVTFRQIDPLYLLDLSDPAAPQVTGELELPGYSAYLHRVADDLLLGVGQEASEDGRLLGSQVSLFDISDRAAPRRVDQVLLGQETTSDVERDHRAFLYWPPTGLAVVPLEEHSATGAGFRGAVGVDVDPAGDLREVGRVTHVAAGQSSVDSWAARIRRSFVAADALYTVSELGLEASDLATLAERSWLAF
ncbi:MAG TPA: beta-propeller domain-containing protein, partial [Egibacteraceae bacterium]|nr:beta-propeller domain-containing protein [Egibacteraceae bacterium]